MARRDPIQSIRNQFATVLKDSPAAAGVLLSVLKQDHQLGLAGLATVGTPSIKRRGRPAGAKNKPNKADASASLNPSVVPKKRGPKPKQALFPQPSSGAQEMGEDTFGQLDLLA